MAHKIKQKELEIFLSRIPDFINPKSHLEQYKTPSSLAAELLFQAYSLHDIMGKHVIDLGCGTGMFSFGAEFLGATPVIGIDKDKECINQAKKHATHIGSQVNFHCTDIATYSEQADTVIMNPPFGAQKQNLHADRIFLEKATELAPVVYSLHLDHTLDFIKTLLKALNKQGNILTIFQFPMKAQFHFHTKLKQTIPVALLRITNHQ